MATSSDFMYDVFLSFKEGTSYAFTDHLYQALLDTGIKIFRDDEKQRIHHLQKSRMSMVVLCDHYASSTRCLDELVNIIKSYEDIGKQIVGVFYKVEPSDVRHQKNSYTAPMIQHEKTFGKDSDKVKAWRSALFKVCQFSGGHCKDNMYETELIKKIVKDTWAKLPPMPLEIKHLVGLDSRFEQVKSLIDIESNDTVCMLGIYGDRGIGKTTFAVYLYNKIRHQFQAGSFLSSVKEKSLEELQKTLLYEMGEETKTTAGSTFRGASDIKRRLHRKRVLLVLDDVDTIKQLESLAGGCNWFGSGSRIIITTRVPTVLEKHNVAIKKYKMEELNYHDALKLFSLYAFNLSEPPESFADISNSIVSYAKGFPSALKVIGSHLKGLSSEEWEMEFDKYRMVPNAVCFMVDSF